MADTEAHRPDGAAVSGRRASSSRLAVRTRDRLPLAGLALLAVASALSASACSLTKKAPAATVVDEARAACLDSTFSMQSAAIAASVALWAATIAADARNSSLADERLVFYTGLIGPRSYEKAFSYLAPVVITPHTKSWTNPYDTATGKAKARAAREARARVAGEIARVRAFKPPRQLGTEIRGCLIRAHELHATHVLLATDLEPYGHQQTAPVDVAGMEVSLVFFCNTNNASVCQRRRDSWANRLRADGAVNVNVIDPATIAELDSAW
jgi:hypothetical protein